MYTVDDASSFFVVARINKIERERAETKEQRENQIPANIHQITDSNWNWHSNWTTKKELNQIKQEHCIRFHCNNDNKIQTKSRRERDTPRNGDKAEYEWIMQSILVICGRLSVDASFPHRHSRTSSSVMLFFRAASCSIFIKFINKLTRLCLSLCHLFESFE